MDWVHGSQLLDLGKRNEAMDVLNHKARAIYTTEFYEERLEVAIDNLCEDNPQLCLAEYLVIAKKEEQTRQFWLNIVSQENLYHSQYNWSRHELNELAKFITKEDKEEENETEIGTPPPETNLSLYDYHPSIEAEKKVKGFFDSESSSNLEDSGKESPNNGGLKCPPNEIRICITPPTAVGTFD